MGGGVSGGTRTQLAGTFLAEQTHFQPPKYTLISVSSALGPDGCPRNVPSSLSNTAERNGRIRPSGGPAPVMTVIPALADIEPLLKDGEKREKVSEGASKARSSAPGSKDSKDAKDAAEDASLRPRRAGGRAAEREAWANEATGRLFAGKHTPWVATRTDAELYSYLAQRSRDPGMAKLASSSSEIASPKAGSTDSSPRSKARQKHSSHNELFDSCLRQDQARPRSVSQMRSVFWSSLPPSCSPKSPGSPRCRPTSQETPKARQRVVDRLYGDYLRREERAKARERLAGEPWDKEKTEMLTHSTLTPRPSELTSRFTELIEDLSVKDIPVLPEDPVETYLQRSKPKRQDSHGARGDWVKKSSYYFNEKDKPVKKSTVRKGSSTKALSLLA